MTTQYYTDGYLATLVTDDREARAAADVATLGTLPADWVVRLIILRAYVLTCLDCQKSPDDTFSAKLSAYRKEYSEALTQARAAQAKIDAGATSGSIGIFSCEIERG